MGQIYAKSKEKVLLVDHSRNVKNVANLIFNLLPGIVKNDATWLRVIELSSLLHDIGKSTKEFQNNLKKGIEGHSKNKFRHNEIGWAFCYRYLNIPSNILTPVLYNIYWHHGISNKLATHTVTEILNSIPQEDINTMRSIVVNLLDDSYILDNPRDLNDLVDVTTPKFYYHVKDYHQDWPAEKLMLTRIIVVSSDQLQSKLESNTITSIDDEIRKIIYKTKTLDTSKCPSNYDIERHLFNIDVAKSATQTTIINGPGGMGKTDIGIHWNSLSNKRFIIVCPMNLVCHSVYNNVESIISNYNLDICEQLFLTGEVVKTNKDNQEAFSSDVNVTNIDNFEKPSIDDKSENHIDRLLMLLFSDIQFDEYHELLMIDSPLFRLFTIIMRMRHNYTESRTLLTSATPLPIAHYWDTIANKTTILPEPNKHFKASHQKQFKIKVLPRIPEVEEINKNNSLIIFNSIKESQRHKKIFDIDQLFHSEFQKSDINKKLEYVYKNYGKKSERDLNKPNIIGARMIQTSIDMSLTSLVESVCSPQDSLQRIPRINRWGDYRDVECELLFFNAYESKSENFVKEKIYSINLSNQWFDKLSLLDGRSLTLDELNDVYNSFHTENNTKIIELIRRKHTLSEDRLVEIYPVRYVKPKPKSKAIIAGSNKLRSSGLELMVTAKIYGENRYCDPISKKIYESIDKDFNEPPSARNMMISTYKHFRKIKDERFDYESIIDNIDKMSIDEFRRRGVSSETPYIRFDVIYHHDYGFIKNSDIEEIL